MYGPLGISDAHFLFGIRSICPQTQLTSKGLSFGLNPSAGHWVLILQGGLGSKGVIYSWAGAGAH